MFDWQAKITRLLELPGLTDEQRKEINDASPFLRWVSAPDGGRNLQQPMRHALERLIEARGLGLTTQSDPQQRTQHDLHRAEIWMDRIDSWDVQCIAERGGETPAQALCDAVLAALEEAPHD